jgi:hypothetical protein
MDILEKVDQIRVRTGLSYREAKELLEAADGDVLEALARFEETHERSEFWVKSGELVNKVKELIHQGNVTNIRIKSQDKLLLDIPLTAGVIATLLAPQVTILAALASLFSQFEIQVERKNQKTNEAPHKE